MRLLILISVILIMAGCKSKPAEVRSENVLQHRLQAKVQSLDPADIGDVVSDAVASEIFECLYTYHYLKRPYELIPQLASEMPLISEDGLIYTIKIKERLRFCEDTCFENGIGREVTADDFVYTFKRIANVKTVSKNWFFFDGRIAGLDEFREYTKTCVNAKDVDYSTAVEGLSSVDRYTLVIKLVKPWPQLVFLLAHLPSAPVAREAVDKYGKDIVSHPVGTGAFMLKTWHRGSYIEMVRNPNHRFDPYPSEGEAGDEGSGLLADAGKAMPFIDRIIWRIVLEDQPRWLMFKQGDLDIMGIPKDNFGQAVAYGTELTDDMRQRGIKLGTFLEPDTFWVGMNMEDPLLGKNRALRLAISAAINRQKWIELFFNGRGDAAAGFIPTIMPGYDSNIKNYTHAIYDLDQAKELLQEAIRTNGRPIPAMRLSMPGTDTTYRQMGQFLEQSLRAIGLEVEAEYLDWPTYLEKLRTKDVQLYSSGWIADYPDVESFLQVFYSKNAPWPNSSNYQNEEFDRIYEQAAVMSDGPERNELYRKAERIVVDDAPVAFMFHRKYYVMYHEWVGNFKPNAYKPDSFGFGLSKYYRIDNESRQAYQKNYK